MSLQLILISLQFYPLVLLRFATSPSPSHVMYPFAQFPFVRFLEDIVQVELPMIRIHTCEFTHTNSYVIDQSHDFVLTTWYSSYLSHPLPSVLTQPLYGYLVLPTHLSIVGLLWRILFFPTHSCGLLKRVAVSAFQVTVFPAEIGFLCLPFLCPCSPQGPHSWLDNS